MTFFALLENELLKVVARGRLSLVTILLTLFVGVSVWGQYRQDQNRLLNEPTRDFQARTEQRISHLTRQAQERRIFSGFTRFLKFEIERLRYHLAQGIDPEQRTGPILVRGFSTFGTALFFPILIVMLGADMISAEISSGTAKLLLTRPVRRSVILLSKFCALALSVSGLLLLGALLSWAFGGLAFGWAGFGAPVVTGLGHSETGVDLRFVRLAPLWLDTLATFGLAWVAAITVASVAILGSVLFQSAAGAIGSLMALLVAGNLLGQLAQDWEPLKYLFLTSLPIAQYYSGVPPPVTGMTVNFCLVVLTLSALVALIVACVLFERRDVTA
jgi:ABC-2 type transport system permease protein